MNCTEEIKKMTKLIYFIVNAIFKYLWETAHNLRWLFNPHKELDDSTKELLDKWGEALDIKRSPNKNESYEEYRDRMLNQLRKVDGNGR